MRITTYSHCCLLIETAGRRILTDPGAFSDGFTELTDLDVILITHEHGDHLHVEALQEVLYQNPDALVITNASVGRILAEKGIIHTIIKDREQVDVDSISLKAYVGEHVEIFEQYGLVENTGFLVNDSLFYPGDAYTVPEEPVEVLAVAVAGPWCKLADAIRYALAVQPKVAFPVHDAVLSADGKQVTYPHCVRELGACGIEFKTFEESKTIEI